MYKLYADILTGEISCVERLSDKAFIPIAPQNIDYQKYLVWLAEGNTPIPPDPPPSPTP